MASALVLLAILAARTVRVGDGYQAPPTETKVPLLAIIYVLVALAGICVVAFRDAKRTHLD